MKWHNVFVMVLVQPTETQERIIVNCFMAVFVLAGVGFGYMVFDRIRKWLTFEHITGICTGRKFSAGQSQHTHSQTKKTYLTRWQYTYDGEDYEEEDAFRLAVNAGLPKEGEMKIILIDPAHPEKPWYPNVLVTAGLAVMALAFLAGGLAGMLLYNGLF